jgi:hypothetical protein
MGYCGVGDGKSSRATLCPRRQGGPIVHLPKMWTGIRSNVLTDFQTRDTVRHLIRLHGARDSRIRTS